MRHKRKYEGPILVIKKVGRASFKIDIPAWMKIHLVIHVNNLKPYHKDPIDPACNQPTRKVVKANPWSSKEQEEIVAERKMVEMTKI